MKTPNHAVLIFSDFSSVCVCVCACAHVRVCMCVERKHAVIFCTFFLFRLPLQHHHQNLGHPLQSLQAVVALEVNSIRNLRNPLGSSDCHSKQAVLLLCLQSHLPLHPNQCQRVCVQLPLCLHHCQHMHLYLRPLYVIQFHHQYALKLKNDCSTSSLQQNRQLRKM